MPFVNFKTQEELKIIKEQERNNEIKQKIINEMKDNFLQEMNIKDIYIFFPKKNIEVVIAIPENAMSFEFEKVIKDVVKEFELGSYWINLY